MKWSQAVPCTDGAGRPREVLVYVDDDDQAGLLVPPGETARLGDSEAVQRLRHALADAIHVQQAER